MKLINILEARRNPHLSKKEDVMEILSQYKDMDDVYISFTDLPKLGINPNPIYKVAPVGIYGFPLKQIWKYYKMEKNGIKNIPYVNNRNYIWVFYGKVKDVSTIKKSDINKLLIYAKINGFDDKLKVFNSIMNNSMIENGVKFVRILKTIAKNTIEQTRILRRLGFNGLSDLTGQNAITGDLRYQAVFFSTRVIKILKIINNITKRDDKEYGEYIKKLKYDLNNSDDDTIIKLLNTNGFDVFNYIKNPSEELKEKIVFLNPGTILKLNNPSEKLKQIAISQYPEIIKAIDSPSEELQLLSITVSNGYCIAYIKKPTIKVQKYAIKIYPDFILQIENPSNEVLKYAVTKKPSLINRLYYRFYRVLPKEIIEYCLKRKIKIDPDILHDISIEYGLIPDNKK